MSEQTVIAPGGRREFSIGGVLSTSTAVFGRNFLPFVVLGLVLSLPVLFLTLYLQGLAASVPAGAPDFHFGPIAAGLIVGSIIQSLLAASLTYGTFQDLRGAPVSFGDVLSRGLSVVIPVVVAGILAGLAVGIGTMLLVVPGLIISTVIWVYVPAIVIEKEGIINSFSRSAALTKGRRWPIFGLTIMIGIAFWLIGIVLALILANLSPMALPYVQYAANAVLATFYAIVTSVGYYYLRSEKEGIEIDEIAKVFD